MILIFIFIDKESLIVMYSVMHLNDVYSYSFKIRYLKELLEGSSQCRFENWF